MAAIGGKAPGPWSFTEPFSLGILGRRESLTAPAISEDGSHSTAYDTMKPMNFMNFKLQTSVDKKVPPSLMMRI